MEAVSKNLDGWPSLIIRFMGNPYILYLPNDFIYPGGRFIVQFYWDSYFIMQSLLLNSSTDLVKGMIETRFYMLDKYGMGIANRKTLGSGIPVALILHRWSWTCTRLPGIANGFARPFRFWKRSLVVIGLTLNILLMGV